MKPQLFYRNVRARDHLELFLISAVSALLLVRFYLHLTGYPQVGNGTLHIAHMLWGGLLMLVAIVLVLSFLGSRVQRLAAFLGGIGFGVFIDELGKFITKDNDYFFQPTIGLIYAIFIILFLAINFLSRYERLTNREYELNALAQFEEVVLRDLDNSEKQRIRELLSKADGRSAVVKRLTELLQGIETIPPDKPGRISRFLNAADNWYTRLVKSRSAKGVIAGLFIIETIIFVVVILGTLFTSFDSLRGVFDLSSYTDFLIIGQLVSSIVSGFFVFLGVVKLPSSRLEAYEMFRRATLINIFLTEFFIFSRIQFAAIPGLVANLTILVALHYAIEAEQRVAART